MPEIKGTDVVIRVNTGSGWSNVGSQTGVKFDDSLGMIDVSSKEARAKKLLPGRYESTVVLDALYVPGAAEYLYLKNACRNGTAAQIRRRLLSNDTEEADCYISHVSEDFPDMAPATCSVTVEITGAWRVL